MTSASAEFVVELLAALGRNDEAAALALLPQAQNDLTFAAMMRTAAFHTSTSPFFYRKLLNAWSAKGRPPLKPSSRILHIEILSDCTVDGLTPYLTLFCAAFGLDARISIGLYDSVEQTAIAPFEGTPPDVSLVLLSEHWLKRHIGVSLVSVDQIDAATQSLKLILEGLRKNRSGHIIIGNFALPSWAPPGTSAFAGERIGQAAAITEINGRLQREASNGINVLDTALAVHMAGGHNASPKLAYLRAHALLEDRGLVQLAREAASGIAQLFGRSHRALLTDWDNTLWGGEVGEVGFHNVICGQDSPDALGYYVLQSYLVHLTNIGILLAAISRNDPAMAEILEENKDIALRRKHFATLALSWGDKSASVSEIERDLNFATDLMVYVDDNPVDLAEVLSKFPYIDIVLAGPTADYTLSRLSSARYFNTFRVTEEDTRRHEMARIIAEQNRAIESSSSPEEFLRSLNIKLTVSPMTDANRPRVLALLQKTNQFNVTTRRHLADGLDGLIKAGAEIGVFSYTDKFGSQGIIGLMIVTPAASKLMIDTWLMSCRVLNRNVEKAMLEWAKKKSAGRAISGTYIPTSKNKLVSKLFDKFGFELISEQDGQRNYTLDPQALQTEESNLEMIYE